jgi:hypothetical protein
MPAVLLVYRNTGPSPIADFLLKLFPALIGMKINPGTHCGIAKCVVANNYILCDRLNHGSSPHSQFLFALPDSLLIYDNPVPPALLSGF